MTNLKVFTNKLLQILASAPLFLFIYMYASSGNELVQVIMLFISMTTLKFSGILDIDYGEDVPKVPVFLAIVVGLAASLVGFFFVFKDLGILQFSTLAIPIEINVSTFVSSLFTGALLSFSYGIFINNIQDNPLYAIPASIIGLFVIVHCSLLFSVQMLPSLILGGVSIKAWLFIVFGNVIGFNLIGIVGFIQDRIAS